MRILLALVPLLLAAPSWAVIDAALIGRLKKSIVNVETAVVVGLDFEETGRAKASGFVVDAEKGWIATNRHVSGTSPAQYKVVFENGESTQAKLLHYDAWHDFALLQVDPADLNFKMTALELGDSFSLQEQDDVVMIGNNDGREYSVKFGKVANLTVNEGPRHSATMQTTFDRAGGSSGSPVFDADGKVVALHFAGTDTTSFELRVEYLKDAIAQWAKGRKVRRGDAGLKADLVLVSEARKNFHLPKGLGDKVLALKKDLKYMVLAKSRTPGSSAFSALLPGDLILSVDGDWLGDDLYKLDRLVDAKAGGEVTVEAVRDGKVFEAKLKVEDAEALKVRRFVRFAGGTVHRASPEVRMDRNLPPEGVFLSQAHRGSSLSELGYEVGQGSGRYLVVIEGVNGKPTPDLDTFVEVVRGLRDGQHVYFLCWDRNAHDSNLKAVPLTLDLKFSPLELSVWSDQDQDWQRVETF